MAELNDKTTVTGNSLLDNLSSGLFNIGDLLDSGAAATGKAIGLPQDTSGGAIPNVVSVKRPTGINTISSSDDQGKIGKKDMNLTGDPDNVVTPSPNKVAATAANTAGFDDTVALQKRLNASGADLIVDGIDGPLTKAAMAQYMPTDDVNMDDLPDTPSPIITDEQMGVSIDQGQDDPDLGPAYVSPVVPLPASLSSGNVSIPPRKTVTPNTEGTISTDEPSAPNVLQRAGNIVLPNNNLAPYRNAVNMFGQGADYVVDSGMEAGGLLAQLLNTIMTSRGEGSGREERSQAIDALVDQGQNFTSGKLYK